MRATILALALGAAVGVAPARAGGAAEPAAATTAAVDHTVRTAVRRTRVGPDTVAWYERGQGPPLLLLTGTGSTMAEWDPALLRLLARRHRLLLVDYVGVGWSSPLRRAVSFAGMADEIAAFLAARGSGAVDVLGWSMGGFVAQQLAIRHPGAVRRLVLAGTNPGGSRAVLGPADAQRTDSDPDASDAAALRELYPRTRAGLAEGRAFLRRLERASADGTIPDDFGVPRRSYAAQVAAEDPWLRSDANWTALGRLTIPVLAAGGRDDRVVPLTNLRRIAAHAPRGTLRVFAGSHAFLFGDRVRFAAAVDRFLSAS